MVNKQYLAFGHTVFGIVSEAVLPYDRQLESFAVSADTEGDYIIRVLPARKSWPIWLPTSSPEPTARDGRQPYT